MFFLGEIETNTREDMRMVKLESFFQKRSFWAYIKPKKKRIHYVVHGYSSQSTFGLHLARDQKAL